VDWAYHHLIPTRINYLPPPCDRYEKAWGMTSDADDEAV